TPPSSTQRYQNLANVTWTLFCEDFLARFGSSSVFLYEPLEKFLEYAHIRMDPARESIDGFLIRFRERREAAGQPNNATAAVDVFTFKPGLPKLATDTAKKLDMVTIITNYNQNMTTEMKATFKQQLQDQIDLKTLKVDFPNVYRMVVDTLEIQRYEQWPKFLWNYENSDFESLLEKRFFKAAQYILTTFADKCNRVEVLRGRGERTFWVDRVVPVMQTIGDQTSLTGFDWCETKSKDHGEANINTDLWMKTSRRFLDGLGFDAKKNELLAMEASSGIEKEDLNHTLDDTLKNLHTSISMISGIIRRNLDASFETMKQVRVFCIQSRHGSIVRLSFIPVEEKDH
ncbi:hypothetical protein DFQ30_002055, partial [Apophysomyces sp. BC1015]